MASYKPTAEDFKDIEKPYKPTASDFDIDEPETKGFSGIAKDIGQGALNAIPTIYHGLMGLPAEVKGAAQQLGLANNWTSNPLATIVDRGLRPFVKAAKPLEAGDTQDLTRVAQNIGGGFGQLGHGILSSLGNIRDYLADKQVIPEGAPSFRLPESILPKDYNYQEALGRKGYRAGDELLSSLPEITAYGGLGELGEASKLGRLKQRAAAGATYGVAENQNPVTQAAAFSLTPEITEAAAKLPITKKSWQQFKENRIANIANLALKTARKDLESGGTLTKNQAAHNRLMNYTNIEGKQMPVDIGTLVGNKTLSDIFKLTSKIPFTGGKKIITQLVKQGFDKADAKAMLAHEAEQNNIVAERAGYADKLKDATAQAEQNNAATQITEQAPQALESLRHPTTPHNDLFKQATTEAYDTAQTQTSKAYEPFNKLDVDLNAMPMPNGFKSKYRTAYDELKEQSESLKELFDTDQDLGNNISREVKQAGEFFDEAPAKTDGKQLTTKTSPFNFKKANPEAITTHIRNLQSLAEEAFAAGKHRQSAQLNKMAAGLKDDMKAILRENGYNEAVDALEKGDELFKKDVLPFYKHRELKKLVTDKAHQLTDTTRVSLAKQLHQPNARPIFNKLPAEAKNASIYEILTEGKYGNRGHGLTPEEIAKRFNNVKSNTRESFNQHDPNLTEYLENLGDQVRTAKATAKAPATIERLQDKIAANEQKELANNERLGAALKQRFQKPTTKVPAITDSVKNISPLKAGGLGVAMFALHNLPAKFLAEGLGAAIPAARAINKAFTMPELLEHYLNDTNVKPKNIKQGSIEQLLREAYKQSGKATAIPESKRKPMELLLNEYTKQQ